MPDAASASSGAGDPRGTALVLDRLRLAGELTELRGVRSLLFGGGDARAAGRERIELRDAGVALLHERTEGWAAGLRLAVISLGEHPDPEQFVREFSGSERTVAGYLLAEVLMPTGGRAPAAAAHLGARARERPARRFPHPWIGFGAAPAAARGCQCVRVLARRGTVWVSLSPAVRRLVDRRLRRGSPATVRSLHSAAAEWYRTEGYVVRLSAMHRRRASGRALLVVYSRTTTWGCFSTVALPSFVSCSLDFRLTRPGTRSWRSCSRPCAFGTGRSKTGLRT